MRPRRIIIRNAPTIQKEDVAQKYFIDGDTLNTLEAWDEMIEKLKSKGFIQNKYSKDVFDGEFNGTDVNIFIGTNNNKVYRIMVSDANTINETDIKIRFNNLIKDGFDRCKGINSS